MKLSSWITLTLTAAAVVSLATMATAADNGGQPSAAPTVLNTVVNVPSCYVGASVGMGASVTRVSGGQFVDDLGSDGYIGGGELGCDMSFGQLVLGGLARYDWNNLGGSIDGTGVDAGGIWTIAAKAGLAVNKGATIYGLLGIAGTKVKIEGVDSESHRGWMAGAGVELAIANSPISIFAEYNYIELGGQTFTGGEESASVDPTVDPTTHVGRVGGRMRF